MWWVKRGLCGASYPAWAGRTPWQGWVPSYRLGVNLALQVIPAALLCHEHGCGYPMDVSAAALHLHSQLCFSFSCITVARAVLVHVKHLRKTMRH